MYSSILSMKRCCVYLAVICVLFLAGCVQERSSLTRELGGFVYPGTDWDMTMDEVFHKLDTELSLAELRKKDDARRSMTICHLPQEAGHTLWGRPVELELTFSSGFGGSVECLSQVTVSFCEPVFREDFQELCLHAEELLKQQKSSYTVDTWGLENRWEAQSTVTNLTLPDDLKEKLDAGQRLAWGRLEPDRWLPEENIEAYYQNESPLMKLILWHDPQTGEGRARFDGDSFSSRMAYVRLYEDEASSP